MIKAARHDCQERLVHNNVILWADVACLRVQDPSHGGRMARRESQVDALVALLLKLGQLVRILELGRQNIGRCAPNSSTTEGIIGVQLGASEQLKRCKPVAFIGHVIPEKHSLFHSKVPQGKIKGCRPMKQLVHHHGLTKVRDGLDTAFNGCVLMMITDTTESLWPILNMSLEFFRIKWKVVSMKLLELDSTLESFFLDLPY